MKNLKTHLGFLSCAWYYQNKMFVTNSLTSTPSAQTKASKYHFSLKGFLREMADSRSGEGNM